MADWLAAIILGLVEGLTEFIPVSSTGHMLLLGHFLGFESTGKTFEIVIQLGALLAIVSVYFKRLWTLATRWPVDPDARRFLIGLFQCLAMIPGVSRSGATIAGGLLLGTDKRSAAEFSFFLALPTMGSAVAYDLLRNWDRLDFSDAGLIALGFGVAFLTALAVVRFLLDFVSRHGFGPFAWWRIAVGLAGLAGLAATGGL